MTILALDLGNSTGWALLDSANDKITSGYIKNKKNTTQFEGGGMRFLRFSDQLNQWHAATGGIQFVGFEEVRAHSGTIAAQIYGGYLAVLTEWCERRDIPFLGFGVGAIKRHATGCGTASKASMIKAAREMGYDVYDDNEADAIHILHLCIDTLGPVLNENTLKLVKKLAREQKKNNNK